MRVLHQTINVAVGPQQKICQLRVFFVKTEELVKWMCVPLQVLYRCDITEAKHVSAERHDVLLNRYSFRDILAGEDMISGELAGERSMGETKIVRNRFLEIGTSNTMSAEDRNKADLEDKVDYGQELLKKLFY